jgi:hypothetical protein
MISLQFDTAGSLAVAHTLLAIATLRGTGEDRALDALLAVEDSILAIPPESHSIVAARATIAIRRLIVASNDPTAPEWGWLMDAIEGLDEHFQEACGAIEALVPIAAAHRDAIIRGNSEDGTSAGLGPDRADEMDKIERTIRWSCCLAELNVPEAGASLPEQICFVPVPMPIEAAMVLAKPKRKPRSRAKTQSRRKVRAERRS